MIDWHSHAEALRRAKTVVFTTHVNPDGDGLGAEMAVGLCLQSLGADVRIINYSETPGNFLFLNTPTLKFEKFNADTHAEVIAAADAIVVVDMNDTERLRAMGKYILESRAEKIILDHHLDPDDFAQRLIVDVDACASGEIGYRLADILMEHKITLPIATALYTAIMTDTGSFRFPRTDPEVHRMAAHLLECGADPMYIYERVYNQSSLNRMRLLGMALGELRLECGGVVGLLIVTQSMFKTAGAREEDVEDFVQTTLSVAGTRMGILAVELRDGVKLSLRSKGNIPVNRMAESFGGGGHKNAAGARVLHQSVADTVERTLAIAKRH